MLTRAFTFQTLADGRPTTQISSLRNTATGYDVTLSYTYDGNGNITSVSDGTSSSTYVYDSANQLIRENNQAAGKTWVWTYDDAGNILSRTEYAYTTGELGDPVDTVLYTYGDADWGDLLTGYDGRTITYDTIGNPTNDGTWTYTWQNGRELASMTNGATTWSFTYDANGMRKTRSNGTDTYTYIYNGSQLVQMTKGSDTLHFFYDATGTPVAVKHNGTLYYYVTTLQGDVLMLLDADGEMVVSYDYDAWGNILAVGGTMATTLGTLNPLTYRGYVFDRETGLYYLQSRYYNPEVGRFLNADAYASNGQGMLGNNMFAYCGNNPANRADPTGHAFVQMRFDPDGASGMLTPGPSGGGSGGVAYVGSVRPEGVKKLAKEVGTAIRTGAEACWDACMRGYSIQQQGQYQELLAKQALYEDIHDYVSDEGFWSTDAGIVLQSTIVSAGMGAGTGFVSGIKSATPILPLSPKTALATIVNSTLGGLIRGAVDGFIYGLVTIALW